MKKLLLLVAVVLAFSFTALAQDTSTSSSGSQTGTDQTTTTTTTKTKKSKKSGGDTGAAASSDTSASGGTKGAKAAKGSQLTGCLAKNAEGNGFMLTNGRYKKGVEVKSSEDLSAHVGHEVQLTGTMEKPTSGEKGGAGAKGETMRTFNATAVKHISDTCTAGGGKMASSKGGKKGAKAGAGTETTPK